MISIVIRARDEARWIGHCLRALRRQKIDDALEIILFDDRSSDETVAKARSIVPDLKLVTCTEPYRPGAAINRGVEEASGERIVLISAHCIPSDEHWLQSLVADLDDPSIAGVYGRQIPFGFSDAADKRDLWQLFGVERRVQRRDGFFHNANSALRRELWQRHPFDEQALHIEDRLWGEQVIGAGYQLVYEPQACVYHHHGVNHHAHHERCDATALLLEDLIGSAGHANLFEATAGDVVAVIPVREPVGGDIAVNNERLASAITAARSSPLIHSVMVCTESPRIADLASRLGAEIPFLRTADLAASDVRVDAVLADFARRLADAGRYPEVIVAIEITSSPPSTDLLDLLVSKLVVEGLDTVIPAIAERRPCWVRGESGLLERRDDHNAPVGDRQPIYIGTPAMACAVRPDALRRHGGRFGPRVGIVEVDAKDANVPQRHHAT